MSVAVRSAVRAPESGRMEGGGILAVVIAIAIAVAGASWVQRRALRAAAGYVHTAAGSEAAIKIHTLTLQRAAFESGHMLPIYGSSELFCCGDPYRATQLFAREPTGFDAFALGRGGTGHLVFLETFGALGAVLDGKKLAIFDSPPWFFARTGIGAPAYAANFSPEIAYAFVFDAPISRGLRAAVARRMLDFPQTLAAEPLLRVALEEVADPTPLRVAVYRALVPLGRVRAWIERTRDAAHTLRFIGHHPIPSPPPQAVSLDWDALAVRATHIAKRRNTSNPFGFPDWRYHRLRQLQRAGIASALERYRSGATNRDGRLLPAPTDWENSMSESREWTDLGLAAAVLHELGARPFLWTLPMPGFYDDYTELSAPARAAYYDRWERAAQATGLPWLDFRADEEDRYFLTDTGAHFSPRGWVFADRALDLFWHDRPLDEIRIALDTLADDVPPLPGPGIWKTAGRGS